MTASPSPYRWLYGGYAWLALAAIVLPLLLLLLLLPRVRHRRAAAHRAARLFFASIGSPVRVHDAERLPAASCVVVANHGSYLDGMILTAALPPSFTFVIKQEMARIPVAGLILRRLGSEFVNRTDSRHRNRVARRILAAARSGNALGFFPEGTFDDSPGLKPFRPGAFAAACRAQIPLVPAVIHGARRKLGASHWLPRPGPLSVRICPPLPSTTASVTELMQAARQRILEHLDEPDLARAPAAGAGGEPSPAMAGADASRADRHMPL